MENLLILSRAAAKEPQILLSELNQFTSLVSPVGESQGEPYIIEDLFRGVNLNDQFQTTNASLAGLVFAIIPRFIKSQDDKLILDFEEKMRAMRPLIMTARSAAQILPELIKNVYKARKSYEEHIKPLERLEVEIAGTAQKIVEVNRRLQIQEEAANREIMKLARDLRQLSEDPNTEGLVLTRERLRGTREMVESYAESRGLSVELPNLVAARSNDYLLRLEMLPSTREAVAYARNAAVVALTIFHISMLPVYTLVNSALKLAMAEVQFASQEINEEVYRQIIEGTSVGITSVSQWFEGIRNKNKGEITGALRGFERVLLPDSSGS